MKKVNVLNLTVAMAASTIVGISAMAQTAPAGSSAKAATGAPANPPPAVSTSEALKEAEAPSTSNWKGSASLYNAKDNDSTTVATHVLYLNVGYKFNPEWTLTGSQRFRYDQKQNSDEQKRPYDLNLRLNLTQAGVKLLGAEGGVLYRLALPTQEKSRNQDKLLAYFLFAPSLTWKASSKVDVSYDFAYQTSTFSSPIDVIDSETNTVKTSFGTALDRQSHGISNSGTVAYNATEQFNVYQRVGHSLALRNSGKGSAPKSGLNVHGSWMDLETGLNYSATKKLSFNFYAAQNYALVESDAVGILAVNGDGKTSSFMWLRPEQTSYELMTTLTF